ncbi:hypothetical protein ACIPM2_32825 [Streptomyces sp. NPDC086081]|uniref:hypothetical protein n=1 Tax=Streptomyces sp. NPDC086081 TaxID=3365749 RepID=UPI00381EC3AD
MAISSRTVATARAYAREMSGAPVPEPPSTEADDGPLKPAHEAAYYLAVAETFRILTRPGQPARPDTKQLRAAVRATPGGGAWFRRGDEAARRIIASNDRIRQLPQDPDQLWALLADVLQALDQLGQAPQLDGSNLRRDHLPGHHAAIRRTCPIGGWGPVRVTWNPDGARRWTDLHHGTWQWPVPTTNPAAPTPATPRP